MALTPGKISPSTVFLYIDPSGGTSYDQVVCLKSFDFSRSTNVIDAATMCGPDKRPGNQDVNISFEGHHFMDADAETVSGYDLNALWQNKTTIGWKISKVTPTTGDLVYTGTGFVSELSETSSDDAPFTFKSGIGVYGSYTAVTTV